MAVSIRQGADGRWVVEGLAETYACEEEATHAAGHEAVRLCNVNAGRYARPAKAAHQCPKPTKEPPTKLAKQA